jgi:hypothetical protein
VDVTEPFWRGFLVGMFVAAPPMTLIALLIREYL